MGNASAGRLCRAAQDVVGTERDRLLIDKAVSLGILYAIYREKVVADEPVRNDPLGNRKTARASAMPDQAAKPHVDPNASRAELVKMEIESAARFGQRAPAFIPRAQNFRVAKSSQTALATRLEITDAPQHQITDRDCAPEIRVGDLSAPERSALETLRPHLEGVRARLDAQLKGLGEAPRMEAIGPIIAKLAEMRATGVDPRWIKRVAEQLDALAHKGMDFKPISSALPGGGQRRQG